MRRSCKMPVVDDGPSIRYVKADDGFNIACYTLGASQTR